MQGIEIIKEIIPVVPGFIANFSQKSISDGSFQSLVISFPQRHGRLFYKNL